MREKEIKCIRVLNIDFHETWGLFCMEITHTDTHTHTCIHTLLSSNIPIRNWLSNFSYYPRH